MPVSFPSQYRWRRTSEAAPFIAISHLIFESVEVFQNSLGPNAEQILVDLPNFTYIQPQIQTSEIKI